MYKRIGYIEAPVFPLLITGVKNILAKGQEIDEAIWKNKISDPTKNLTEADITAMKENLSTTLEELIPSFGNYFFTTAAQICQLDSSVRYLVGYYLLKSGRIADPQNLPVRLKRQLSHFVTLPELLEEFAITKLDLMTLPGSQTASASTTNSDKYPKKPFATGLKRDVVIAGLLQAAISVISTANLIPSYRDTLAAYINTIVFKVSKNLPIDQFDKTLLSYALTPAFRLDSQIAAASDARYDSDSVYVMNEIKSFIQNNYLPGPFSNVTGMVSTGGLSGSLLYIGPYTPEVILTQGRIVPFFKVSTLHLSETERQPWNAETLRKYQLLRSNTEQFFGGDSLTYGASIVGSEPPLLDEPDVTWFYDKFHESLRARYSSTLENKIKIIDHTEEYWVEKFSVNPITQPSQIGLQNIDKFYVVDTSLIATDLVSVDREVTFNIVRKQKDRWEFSKHPVNLRAALPGGSTFVRPIVGPSFVVDQSDLLKVDLDVVGLVQGQLGLSNDEASQNRHIISYQYLAFKFRELFGINQEFIKPENVEKFVYKLYDIK